MLSICVWQCYDNPAALNTYLTAKGNGTHGPGLSSTQFNGLYSAYSFPNMVLPFFGGYLVDKLGCRVMVVVFSALLVLGQAIFALGTSIDSYAIMLLGRVFYGFGGESLCVAAQTMLAEWFMGREMALAMGINLSVSRLGSVVNDQTSVAFYKRVGLAGTLWIGVVILAASLLAALAVAAVDSGIEAQEAQEEPDPSIGKSRRQSRCTVNEALTRSFTSHHSSLLANEEDPLDAAFEKQYDAPATLGAGSFRHSGLRGSMPDADLEAPEVDPADPPYKPVREPSSSSTLAEKAAVDEEGVEVSLWDVKEFGASFWMLSVGCVVVYATVLPFNNVASGFLSHKYYPGLIAVPSSLNPSYKEEAVTYANAWMMIPFFISATLSPFLGGVVDRCGHRASAMLLSASCLVAVHTFFALAPGASCPGHRDGICYDPNGAKMSITGLSSPLFHPAVGLCLLGVAYSVYAAAIWPAVVYVVKSHQVGTAYGLVTAVQNSGLAIAPLVVGSLTKTTPASDPSQDAGGYRSAEWFFVACGLTGVAVSMALNLTADGQRLNQVNPHEVDDGKQWPRDLEAELLC